MECKFHLWPPGARASSRRARELSSEPGLGSSRSLEASWEHTTSFYLQPPAKCCLAVTFLTYYGGHGRQGCAPPLVPGVAVRRSRRGHGVTDRSGPGSGDLTPYPELNAAGGRHHRPAIRSYCVEGSFLGSSSLYMQHVHTIKGARAADIYAADCNWN